jgi:hypothetical protein
VLGRACSLWSKYSMLKQYTLSFFLKLLSFLLQNFGFISIVLVCYQFQFKSTSEFSNLFMLPFVKLFSSVYFILSKLVYPNSIYIWNMFWPTIQDKIEDC